MKRVFITNVLILVSTLLLCIQLAPLSSFAASGEKKAVRRFNLPGHGTLEISVPASWEEKVDQPSGGYPPTITLTSKKRDRMQMIIKPLWSMTQKQGFNSPERLQKILERDARDMLPGSVEGKVAVKEIKRKEGNLFYFTLTNKEPKAGEYSYATRAQLGTGGLLLSIVILTDSGNSKELRAALEALGGARQVTVNR